VPTPNLLTNFNGPASWSVSKGVLTGAPTTFVNGTSSTTTAQIDTPQHADQFTVQSGAITGHNNLFNVFGPIDHIDVFGPSGSVNQGQTFTVTARARDVVNNFLTDYNDPSPSWTDLSGGISPKAPNGIVNGESVTMASISACFTGDRIVVGSSTATG